MDAFLELGIIILLTLIITFIIRALKQPTIIGYILSGILAGPYFLDLIKNTETIHLLSQIGIALLLFIVGISLNPKHIKETGKVSVITGVGQVIFTSIAGLLICLLLGFTLVESIYVAVAITFSSTIIIMKLLSDKGALQTLYGRIAMGFLIVQDIIAALILMMVPALASQEGNIVLSITETLLKGIGIIAIILLFGYTFLQKIVEKSAKNQEVLLLLSISWVLVVASIFHLVNFSIEIGALIAGITLSASKYRHEISSKLRPMRDFFLILFFILLGSQLIIQDVIIHMPTILILSAFILIGNPLIVMVLMGLSGYTKKNGFMAGLTVAQISEFSLILIALGLNIGHLTETIMSIVTMVGLITIAGSTYMIMYSDKIYNKLKTVLTIFEKKGKKKDQFDHHIGKQYDAVMIGCNRTGHEILHMLKKQKYKILVMEYDPETVKKLTKEGIDVIYGDASDIETINEIDFKNTKILISTIPDFEANSMMLNMVKDLNKKMMTFMVANEAEEAIELYEKGASYVIVPHMVGGFHASAILEKHGFDIKKILKEKIKHKNRLKKIHKESA
ncbi:cation:proton antiporter [Candidatus Woesearchaeota archaeon]|nr:cation:proton antiporter [Candidatus Woesearchaeota archaeon]MCF7900621.1 cation:proton antiporter [Candidatus Woesearchaeota archaeon]MCF8013462.1 cation:proton antiporter [Candidatus Woesearchaeota archaeon]